MAKFSKTVVTNSGISTIETAIAQSKPVIFTTVKSGSGTHQESENLKLATGLKEEKQSFPVAEAGTTGKGQIKVRSDITNANLQIGYYINEIGIYAKVEGGQEVLFGITSAIFADYLPDEATAPATIITEFYIQVENAENITFTYEFPQDVYATKEELELKLDKKDAFSKSYNDLKDKPTAIKNPQPISINGKTYDGSVAVNTGTQGIAYGGTGATTASAARTALGLGTAAVKGVANNLTTTEDGFLLDAKQGKVINESLTEINQSLNGNVLIAEGSGAATKYYIQAGADTASKKLLGDLVKYFTKICSIPGKTSFTVSITDSYSNYKNISTKNIKVLLIDAYMVNPVSNNAVVVNSYTYNNATGVISGTVDKPIDYLNVIIIIDLTL